MQRRLLLVLGVPLLLGVPACGGGGDDGAGPGDCNGDRLVTTSWGDEGRVPWIVLTSPELDSVQRVSPEGVAATDPTFSPDGSRVAYVSHVGDFGSDGPVASTIHVVGVDGSDDQRVTGGPSWSDDREVHAAGGPKDREPDWSPTEDRIAFTHSARSDAASDDVIERLYVVTPGSEPELLLDDPAAEGFAPAWSPDGRKIAFLRPGATAGFVGLWVVDADGSNLRGLAELEVASEVAWSPAGDSLLVGGYEHAGVSARLVPLRRVAVEDGAVTDVAATGGSLAWSADGKRLFVVAQPAAGTAQVDRTLTITAITDGSFAVTTQDNDLTLLTNGRSDGLDATGCD